MSEEPDARSTSEPVPVEQSASEPPPAAVTPEVPRTLPPPIPLARLPRRTAGGTDLLAAVAIIWGVEFALGVVCGVTGLFGSEGFEPVAFFVVMILASAVTVLVSWSYVCGRYGKSFKEGFAIRPVTRKTLLVSLLIGVGGAAVAATVIIGLGRNHSLLIRQDSGLLALGLGMILIVTLPPIEEIYYRGFIFPIIERGAGTTAAIVLVTLWFTAAHWVQFFVDAISIPIILVIGAVFAVQRHLTGSLVPSIVTHWSYNATLVAIVLAMEITGRY